MRRRISIIAVSSIVALLIASTATAKVIPEDTEVTVDGRTAIVTVDVDPHTGLGQEELANELGYMVALYPVSALDESGRPARGDTGTPLEFQVYDDDTYRAVLEFPENGEWAIVPFPFDPEMSAAVYPTTSFTVSDPGVPLLGLAGWVGVVALVAALVIWAAIRGRRLTMTTTSPASGTSGA
jgi:hypothetical protein